MARRWAGPALGHKAATSLAGKYAAQLRLLHAQCESDEQYMIDVLGYTSGMMQGVTSSPFFPDTAAEPQGSGAAVNGMAFGGAVGVNTNDESMTERPLSQLPSDMAGVSQLGQVPPSGLTPGTEMHPDQLSAISHMLMNEDFMTMDRVISLDDMIFAAPQGNQGQIWAPAGGDQV